MTATDLAAQLSAQLRTVRFGRPLHVHAVATSTNDLALVLVEQGAAEGTAVLALAQSHGRGRLGRAWDSPLGGLYLSVVLHPSLPRERWPLIGLACALGTAAAAEMHARASVRLKWPNDLLLEGGKVGGILVEAVGGAAVCGIGLNVIPPSGPPVGITSGGPHPTRSGPMSRGWSGGGPQAPSGSVQDDSPHGIVMPIEAAWLAARNPDVSVRSLVPDVLLECERRYLTLAVDPAAVITEWRTRTATLGRTVHVDSGEPVDGVAEDIDADGALLVRTASGLRRVVAGDVTISDGPSAR